MGFNLAFKGLSAADRTAVFQAEFKFNVT